MNYTYLKGMAFIKTERGFGPAVYLLIIKGSIICIGIIGTPNKASFCLGTPSSINFNAVTASAAANPI